MSMAKLSQKFQIVIPKEARQKMGVRAGDALVVHSVGNVTVIFPKPKSVADALKGQFSYGAGYLKGERNAW